MVARWLALAYFGVRVLPTILYIWGTRHDPGVFRATLRLASWFVAAAFVALVGGFVGSAHRPSIWLIALIVDVAGAFAAGAVEWRASASRVAKRVALIVIIAFGESILAIGVGSTHLNGGLTLLVSVVIVFVGFASLWWAYFDFTPTAAEHSRAQASNAHRRPLARHVFSVLRLPMAIGILFYSLAAEKTVVDWRDPLSGQGRWALGLGIALFLVALSLIRFRIVRRMPWETIGAAAAALVLAHVFGGTHPDVTLGIVVGVLVISIAIGSARLREVRRSLERSERC